MDGGKMTQSSKYYCYPFVEESFPRITMVPMNDGRYHVIFHGLDDKDLFLEDFEVDNLERQAKSVGMYDAAQDGWPIFRKDFWNAVRIWIYG